MTITTFFPECCREHDVNNDCLPLCSYNHDITSLSLEYAYLCESYIGTLLACGAGTCCCLLAILSHAICGLSYKRCNHIFLTDGRDHSDCCKRRFIPEHCQKFCNFSHETALSYQFEFVDLLCLDYLSEVLDCMEEGLGKLYLLLAFLQSCLPLMTSQSVLENSFFFSCFLLTA